MSPNIDKKRLIASLIGKSNEELVGMAYISVDEYTIEGIECAKEILTGRGLTADSIELQELLPKAVSDKVSDISTPKEKNPLNKLYNLKNFIWGFRSWIVYLTLKLFIDFSTYKESEFGEAFAKVGIYIFILLVLETISRRRKMKDKLLIDEKIDTVYSNVEKIIKE
jgi:hypothetical protein